MTNPIIEYNEKIQSGEIVANEKIKKVYRKLVFDITENPLYRYDEKKANHAIKFIEKYCKHSKGKWGGKPIVLELWQKAFIAAIFGIVYAATGLRKFREVILLIARKNGKSLIASAIALYCLVADGELGADCYSVATKRDQAKIVWTEAVNMVRKSPALRKRLKCLIGEIKYEKTVSKFQPLSSDSGTLDGLNVQMAVIDELHEIKDKNLIDVINNGTSAREQPLVLITTTCGQVRENVFDQKYEAAVNVIDGYFREDGKKDENLLPLLYELDNRNEWQDEECWVKANPNLGVSKSLEYLRREVLKAENDPINLKNTLCKDFNIRETATQAWLTFEEAVCEKCYDIEDVGVKYALGGFDLSDTTDLCSAGYLFKIPDCDDWFGRSMYWIPEARFNERLETNDKVPYRYWAEKGLLKICPGNAISQNAVKDWFMEEYQQYGVCFPFFGYDRWMARYLVEDMQNTFGGVFDPIAQGKKTLSAPMKEFGAIIKSHSLNYNDNDITRWCLTNVSIDIDKNDNIQPCKFNINARIDGFAALLNAYVTYCNHANEYNSLVG